MTEWTKRDIILALALESKVSTRTVTRWLDDKKGVSHPYNVALGVAAEKLGVTVEIDQLRAGAAA